MTSKRFAFYGRLSTTDKQDPALSFPSQRKACERKAAELAGEITCEFTDQESGAKAERPGWTALTAEARDRDGRRFDAVVIYSTSRLARDRLHAALFERELRKVGVAIHYATGGGDPSTPEGSLRCCAGHQPLSMQGRARRGHRYYACAYVQNYGETAAREAHGGQKWVYVREDWLERLVLRFFEQRIFGPMRLERLAKQLRAHDSEQRRNGRLAGARIRQQIAELERKIRAQVQALEKGIEPELVSERIAELRGEKEALEEALAGIGTARQEAEDEELDRAPGPAPGSGPGAARGGTPKSSGRYSRHSTCKSPTTRPSAVSNSRRPSRRPSRMPSRTRKPSKRRASSVVATDIAGVGFEPTTSGL